MNAWYSSWHRTWGNRQSDNSRCFSTYRNVKPTLTGKELKALGLKPGPLYRTILARLTEARLDGEVTSEERALVKDLCRTQGRSKKLQEGT